MKYQIGFRPFNIWITRFRIDLSLLPIFERKRHVEYSNKVYISNPMFERFVLETKHNKTCLPLQ